MIFSDLPTPAEASVHALGPCKGFAQAGNRYTLFRDHALAKPADEPGSAIGGPAGSDTFTPRICRSGNAQASHAGRCVSRPHPRRVASASGAPALAPHVPGRPGVIFPGAVL